MLLRQHGINQQTVEQRAEKVAGQWQEGLQKWAEDGQRI